VGGGFLMTRIRRNASVAIPDLAEVHLELLLPPQDPAVAQQRLDDETLRAAWHVYGKQVLEDSGDGNAFGLEAYGPPNGLGRASGR
jgi:hypothetical protein